jgi:hypothetical protein
LKGYVRQAEASAPLELLELISGYFALTGKLIHERVRNEGCDWLAARGWRSRAVVKLHLGPVALGRVGSPGEEIIDVCGKTVNVAASLPSTGLALSPAAFRSLEPQTRQLFKKHTPPITYISADDARPD